MNETKPPINAGLMERIVWYVQEDRNVEAEALAKLGDFLEECWSWELTFE